MYCPKAENPETNVKEHNRGRLTKDGIRIYEDADFAGMRLAGQLAAAILDEIAEFVVPGVTTARLDEIITNKRPRL